jgi:RND family efflux transporter MFP subunit
MRSAEADAERNKLNLEFTRVNAEIAGRIDRRLVTKGNLVESGPVATLLTTIVSMDPIYVYFNPDEMAFLKYSQRRVAADGAMETQHVRERKIEVTIILADGTVYPTKGQINFAANRVDPATGTIQVRASFLNPQRALTPGLFVRVDVAAEESYTATLVPERAIGTDQSDKFVYIVDDKQTAQRRNVVLGTKQGRLRVIKSGITPQDKVVISGGLLVRPGQQVEAKEGQMEESPAQPVAVTQFKPAIDATSAASSPLPATAAPRVPANPSPYHAPVER